MARLEKNHIYVLKNHQVEHRLRERPVKYVGTFPNDLKCQYDGYVLKVTHNFLYHEPDGPIAGFVVIPKRLRSLKIKEIKTMTVLYGQAD